ncbi:MAG: glycine cleavage system aminomethyltransferase GcvT [Gammaproteobacteria bacterium]|nr:glycine cleavage system aminomethyltransferase GcvT [Kiritimatiellia bacterium]NKB62070.1 glycine cleavage system aminomethyltransferase GcvT [Gammaproteobacteria bacterium]
MNDQKSLKQTALLDFHKSANARIVPFAGYEMPVNYEMGIIKEHLHTREKAGLFDVSHMGQISVRGNNAAQLLESLIPVDIQSLGVGRQKYGMFLNEQGGILDDLMIINHGDEIILVVNAGCKEEDFDYLHGRLADRLSVEKMEDKALLALQGPLASSVAQSLTNTDLSNMKFMDVREISFNGIPCLVSRSGYTGEDGFEISVSNDQSVELAETLIDKPEVELIGLGARDSLRLEAGLCLYGHDINEDTTPIEANLNWAISPSRRTNGERVGNFPGADIILSQMPKNVSRLLVGLLPQGRAPMREGVEIVDNDHNVIGQITSGGFSPSLGCPISMGYVDIEYAKKGNELHGIVRNKHLPITVSNSVFVPHRYYR